MDIDGSNERTLTIGAWPSWSTDGKKIAFNAPGVGNVGDIWIINVDGTGLTNLTQTPSGEARPAWSPNGQQIAFLSNRHPFHALEVDHEAHDQLRSGDGRTARAA